jgi:hypothetical protein
MKSEIISSGKKHYELKLQSNVYVHAINLCLPPMALPEDNYFDLLPGEIRTIKIQSPTKLTNQAVSVKVLIRHEQV